jgi:hypothetical protein
MDVSEAQNAMAAADGETIALICAQTVLMKML